MILQALAEHYDVLVKQTTTQTTQRQIAPRGWTYAKISFALCIDDDGELERVESTRTGQTQEKKTVMAPRLMSLPAPVKRSSGIASNFLWDNSSYLLGVMTRASLSAAWIASMPAKPFTISFWMMSIPLPPGRCWPSSTAGSLPGRRSTPPFRRTGTS